METPSPTEQSTDFKIFNTQFYNCHSHYKLYSVTVILLLLAPLSYYRTAQIAERSIIPELVNVRGDGSLCRKMDHSLISVLSLFHVVNTYHLLQLIALWWHMWRHKGQQECDTCMACFSDNCSTIEHPRPIISESVRYSKFVASLQMVPAILASTDRGDL